MAKKDENGESGGKAQGRPALSEEEKTRRASLPAFLWETGSGVKVSLAMDNPTKIQLEDYLDWASSVSGLPRNETELRFLSVAIGKAIKADPAYAAHRKAASVTPKP